jgi:heterotetrameric sarcosine oxidase gamma subunit
MAKQSALYHWAAEAGAVFTEHHGWQMPARFSDAREEAAQVVRSAGLADVSWMSKFMGPRDVMTNTAGPLTTDVSSVFAQFLLAGPRSRDVLTKLTSLNVSERALPDGACRQTSLAHVHATVLRNDLGAVPAFHLLVARDYGESVWQAVLHAGHEFHVVPFGLDALAILEGKA